MGQTQTYIRIALATLLSAAGGFLLKYKGKSQPERATFAPFVARLVENHFDSGDSIVPAFITYITVARRQDGSQVRYATVHSPDYQQVGRDIDILDVPDRELIGTEPFTKSMATFQLSGEQLSNYMQAQEACPKSITQITDRSNILGQEVYRIHSSEQDHGVVDTDDQWVAPDLACFTVREVYTVASGPRNEKSLISLTLGDPPASMFQIPHGYVERSPSQIEAAWETKFPGTMYMSESAVQVQQRRYTRHRN